MKRPNLDDSKYWSGPVQEDGIASSYCLHEQYQKDLNDYIDHLRRETRDLLCDFFIFFRDNGEANIGMTIEQFVDGYLNSHNIL